MEGNNVRRNIRNVIEMFEARANTVEDEDAADITNAEREAFNLALGMRNTLICKHNLARPYELSSTYRFILNH